MNAFRKKFDFLCCAALLFSAAGLILTAPAFLRGSSNPGPEAPVPILAAECTFSDGSTIVFGREALGLPSGSGDHWRTGPYEATALRVSEKMVIPPVTNPLEIPAGTYTAFVIDQGKPPWTLIISKKAGEWGMSYPGEQYDLGRARLGSDLQPPVKDFVIGCKNFKDTGGPIFLWMQSGRYVAYAKVLAAHTEEGKTELLVH